MSVNWAELGLKALAAIVILVVTAILAVVVKGAVAKLAQRIPALQRPGADGAGLGASIGAIAAQHPACAEAASQPGAHHPGVAQPAQPGHGQPAPGQGSEVPEILSQVEFALIMIVVSIAALLILGIASISEPASAMLTAVFTAIPKIVAAVVLVVLGFPQVTAFLSEILALGGNVLFGGAVIILFTTMGLQSMGVADSIIEMAFSALVIGAAAAAALAFGLGGRDAAARQLAKPESAPPHP